MIDATRCAAGSEWTGFIVTMVLLEATGYLGLWLVVLIYRLCIEGARFAVGGLAR